MQTRTIATIFWIIVIGLSLVFQGCRDTSSIPTTVEPTRPASPPEAHVTEVPLGEATEGAGVVDVTSQPKVDVTEVPPLSYQITSQISLKIDLETVAPSDVKNELSAPPAYYKCLFCGGGACYPDLSASYVGPTIVGAATSLHERTSAPYSSSWLDFPDCPDIYVCGYEENEPLIVSLINPLGQVMLKQGATAEPVRDYNREAIRTYCYETYEISFFDFLPEDPLGEYTIEILSKDSRLVHRFALLDLTSPVIYYSNRLENYVIAGFEPFEEIRILVYKDGGFTFTGGAKLKLDENGAGLLTDNDLEAILFVVRENLDFISTDPDSRSPLNYDKIIELEPKNAKAYYYRSIYDHEFEFDEAIADLSRAIEIDPGYPPAYYERGRLYEEQDNYERAIADYSQAIKLDPGHLSAYRKRSELYEKQGQYDQAIADYSKIIELAPASYPRDVYLNTYYKRAHLYEKQGLFDQAIADYSKQIELAPGHPLAYYERGVLYSSHSNYDGAITDFTKAIEIYPNYSSAYYARARLYDEQGNYNLAITDFTKAIELGSDKYGGDAGTIADYTKAIELDPDYALAYYKRGVARVVQFYRTPT
ncbi:MAG: tetratricopeptide repeat protein [Anaerolineae bacterium]|nr:tetratricopeptide repeat protein [Anaerolineae bacterium]